jgi:hypothetical protein
MSRLAWLAAGFGLGAVVVHRATRGGEGTVLGNVADGVTDRVRRSWDAAVAEGRVEMAARESMLRSVFARPSDGDRD